MPLSRFRRRRARSVEELQAEIGVLVARRQVLQEERAERARLEQNRRQLARCQWELSLALIERHLPQAA